MQTDQSHLQTRLVHSWRTVPSAAFLKQIATSRQPRLRSCQRQVAVGLGSYAYNLLLLYIFLLCTAYYQQLCISHKLQSQRPSHGYLTRGSQTNILIRPKARSNHSKLSFLGTAADIWNQLPPGIRQIPDYTPFVKECQVLFST